MYFYDTNSLLDLRENSLEIPFAISSVSLQELESIKTNRNKTEEIRAAARRVTRWLDENEGKFIVVVYDKNHEELINNKKMEIIPDTKIIACACSLISDDPEGIIFVTNDISCKNIAKKIFGLRTVNSNFTDTIYKGYRRISGNTNQINDEISNFDLNDWNVNEYLIIHNTDDDSEKELRFDGKEFVSLKLPPSKFIKAKNSLQRCALDIMNNPDITIAAILGGYGSGKTFLSMQMALYNVQEKGRASKILGVRETVGEGKEQGFLPGDLEDKVGRFFEPLCQSLNGGEFELANLKMNGVLDTNVPFYMKGTTYNETIILCDEAEDLTEAQIRLVGTRLGENSKIFLAGDYKQSLLRKTTDNALIKMCNEFKGNPMFGCIYLGEDVRSTTSKLFADLFED